MNDMMVILFLTIILCNYSVFGMDCLSDTPDSNNVAQELDLTEYTKQELKSDDSYDNRKIIVHDQNKLFNKYFEEKNLTKKYEKKFDETNELKRKCHASKICEYEYCGRTSSTVYLTKGPVSGLNLCNACYKYEKKKRCLKPRSERPKKLNKKNEPELKRKAKVLDEEEISFCEFCRKESIKYTKGRISGKSLCGACYQYEKRHGHLLLPNERRKTKHHVLVCDCCHKGGTIYRKSQIGGKSLCDACYQYERRHGHLLLPDERNKTYHHVLVCEFCQQESTRYAKGKCSGKSLCRSCYDYESRHGHLLPLDERKQHRYKHHVLVCEVCLNESKYYMTGKISGKSLCRSCYGFEYLHGHSIPAAEERETKKHKDSGDDRFNRSIVAKEYLTKDDEKIESINTKKV